MEYGPVKRFGAIPAHIVSKCKKKSWWLTAKMGFYKATGAFVKQDI